MFNAQGKAKSVQEWAKGWKPLDEYLKLNALVLKDGDAAIIPVYSDLVVDDTEYADGTAKRRFSFQLRIVTQWSDGYDSVNEDAIALVSGWIDWVNKQFDLENYPDFDGAIIVAIESDQNMPAINVTNAEDGTAEYYFFGRIDYIE